jgi:hypothetical protein
LELELGCDIVLLGIQPASTEMGEELSVQVRSAVDCLTGELGELLLYPDVVPALA